MPALEARGDCLSSLELDRHAADDLSVEERQTVEGHLESCVRCALRREVMLADRAAFLQRLPTWDAVQARRTPRKAAAVGVVLLTAAAAVLLAVSPGELLGVRSKGGPQLGAYIKRGERVTRAQSGDLVQPGDWLRLTYTSAKPRHFAVLHRDARSANIYFPQSDVAVKMEAGRDVALSFGIRLDSEPGEEQLYGLFCDEAVALEPLRAALQLNGQVPSSAHCQVDTLTLFKQLEGK